MTQKLPLFLLSIKDQAIKAKNQIDYRNYKNFNEDSFLEDLRKSNFSVSTRDPNKSYSHLSKTFYGIVAKHAHLKKKTLSYNHAPFINKMFKKQI